MASDSLRLRIEVASSVRAGDPVPITVTLENTGDRSRDLYLRGRTVTFDVLVHDPDGALVWRRLEGEIIPAIIQLRSLAPGEKLELSVEWSQRDNSGRRVGPGLFTVQGQLLTDEPVPMKSPVVPLEIMPDSRSRQ